MIKLIITFLFTLNVAISFAQSMQENLKRYWYYRQRFLNDYILVGDCDGCSVPANVRGVWGSPDIYTSNTLNWGTLSINFLKIKKLISLCLK